MERPLETIERSDLLMSMAYATNKTVNKEEDLDDKIDEGSREVIALGK